MFQLDDHTLIIFSQLNHHTYRLYYDHRFWLQRIDNMYPNFPALEVCNDVNIWRFIGSYPLNLMGLSNLLSRINFAILRHDAIHYGIVPILRWLLKEYKIKRENFNNAICYNNLEYIKFLCEDCQFNIRDIDFEKAVIMTNYYQDTNIVKYLLTKIVLDVKLKEIMYRTGNDKIINLIKNDIVI